MKILGAVYLSIYLSAYLLPITAILICLKIICESWSSVFPTCCSGVFLEAPAPHLVYRLRGWRTKLKNLVSFVFLLVALWQSFFLRDFLKCDFYIPYVTHYSLTRGL